MSMDVSMEIKKKLQEIHRDRRIVLPRGVQFSFSGDALKVTLPYRSTGLPIEGSDSKNKDAYVYMNMQHVEAAFEGWILAIKQICTEINNSPLNIIILGIEEDNKIPYFTSDYWSKKDDKYGQKQRGHYGRFLYRCLKFKEQYKNWFFIDGEINAYTDSLYEHVCDFSKYLDNNEFINNVPDSIASKNDHKEIQMEAEFEVKQNVFEKLIRDIDYVGKPIRIYRQLPVGVFKTSKSNKKKLKAVDAIFTGGKSAIDFWLINSMEDKNKFSLSIIELKTDNIMIGIVTEIFFYSNLIRDFLINKSFVLNDAFQIDDKCRGYFELYNHREMICEINAIMIADCVNHESKYRNFHPLVQDALKLLQEDNCCGGIHINYQMLEYKMKQKRYMFIKNGKETSITKCELI